MNRRCNEDRKNDTQTVSLSASNWIALMSLFVILLGGLIGQWLMQDRRLTRVETTQTHILRELVNMRSDRK